MNPKPNPNPTCMANSATACERNIVVITLYTTVLSYCLALLCQHHLAC